MTDLVRSILVVAAGLACGLSVTGAVHYFKAFRYSCVRFDLALTLTFLGTAGLALYALFVTTGRLGDPTLRPTTPLALASAIVLIFGLIGVLVERGRLERDGGRLPYVDSPPSDCPPDHTP